MRSWFLAYYRRSWGVWARFSRNICTRGVLFSSRNARNGQDVARGSWRFALTPRARFPLTWGEIKIKNSSLKQLFIFAFCRRAHTIYPFLVFRLWHSACLWTRSKTITMRSIMSFENIFQSVTVCIARALSILLNCTLTQDTAHHQTQCQRSGSSEGTCQYFSGYLSLSNAQFRICIATMPSQGRFSFSNYLCWRTFSTLHFSKILACDGNIPNWVKITILPQFGWSIKNPWTINNLNGITK